MPEELPYGGYVGSVFAEDPDEGTNAYRLYTINAGPDSNKFFMDSIYLIGSGVVKVKEVCVYLKFTFLEKISS